MIRLIFLLMILLFTTGGTYAEEKTHKGSPYALEVQIDSIPSGLQTLFVPVEIDTGILDFDKVVLEGVSAQNILAVASNSKDKVGTGIGLIKFDDKGLPQSLTLKVLLKPVSQGMTNVSLGEVANEPALLSKGVVLDKNITVEINGGEIEVQETTVNGKKKLLVNPVKLTLDVKRQSQKEETFFIPLFFDKEVIDIDETFGHAVLGGGISAKTFSSSSLHEGGPGVEVVLSGDAEKDFSVIVDLIPRKAGSSTFVSAVPQRGHVQIVKGPKVSIHPDVITVSKVGIVKAD